MSNNVSVSGGSSNGNITVRPSNTIGNATVTAGSTNSSVETINNAAWYYSEIAKQWAISDSIIENTDYSSKFYAERAGSYAVAAGTSATLVSETLVSVQQAGTEAISTIGALGTVVVNTIESGIGSINATTTSVVTSVTEAGTEALSVLAETTLADLGSISTATTNSLGSISTALTEATSSIESAGSSVINSATSTIASTTEATLAIIGSAETGALTTIGGAKTEALSTINTVGTGYVNTITTIATRALTSASHSSIWAEGTDEEVQALGGVHSAKGWANESSTGQVQADWNESDNTSKAYIKNKPTIPAAQVNSDWNAVSGVSQILNKPTLATVATSGSYNDLSNKPTIPAQQTVDQTYSAASTNAQSGVAINSAGFLTSSSLSGYAHDNSVVHLTNDETINGDKTFNTSSSTYKGGTLYSYDNNYKGYVSGVSDGVAIYSPTASGGIVTLQADAVKINNSILVSGTTGLIPDDRLSGNIARTADIPDVSDFANKSLSNVNTTGTSTSAGWAMPSTTYDTLTVGASGTTYTAPANGYFVVSSSAVQAYNYLTIYVDGGAVGQVMGFAANDFLVTTVPVYKGQELTLLYGNGTPAWSYFRFVYAKGSESEAG